jgi:hypothetical protein
VGRTVLMRALFVVGTVRVVRPREVWLVSRVNPLTTASEPRSASQLSYLDDASRVLTFSHPREREAVIRARIDQADLKVE